MPSDNPLDTPTPDARTAIGCAAYVIIIALAIVGAFNLIKEYIA